MKISHLIVVALAAASACGLPASGMLHAEPAPELKPLEPRYRFADLKSTHTGETHRVFLSLPSAPPPPGGFPVIYVLDGNWYFSMAADALVLRQNVGELPAAVVVGVGYPDDGWEVVKRRYGDLSLPAPLEILPSRMQELKPTLGGADAFLRFLTTELQPFVQRSASINQDCQTIYGHSLGGLFVLHALFTSPKTFQSYVAASPAIWWNGRSVLAEKPNFEKTMKGGGLAANLLLTVGRLEQPANVADPELSRRVAAARMVDNVTDLGADLADDFPDKLKVSTWVFEEETHNSVVPASLARALTFGSKCPAV